jgi:hypothetical protein
MLKQAGLLAIEIRRVVRPVFGTELQLDAKSFEPAIVEAVLSHDEAETYQFVVKAVPDNGDHEISRLAARAVQLEEQLRRQRLLRIAVNAECAALRTSTRTELASAKADAERWRRNATANAQRLERVMKSKTMRYTAPLRSVYRFVRSVGR